LNQFTVQITVAAGCTQVNSIQQTY